MSDDHLMGHQGLKARMAYTYAYDVESSRLNSQEIDCLSWL
jgi:hypothetical protein